MPQLETFPERVKRLARERKMSVSALGLEAWDRHTRGTSKASLDAAMQGKRRPSTNLIESIAPHLKTTPLEFPEYALAALREVPDERKVGLDEAVAAATAAATIVLEVEAYRDPSSAAVRRLRDHVRKVEAQRPDENSGEEDGREGSGG